MTSNDYSYKNVLVTGGAGFIGSNFIEFFLDKHPSVNVVNLDLLTYAANTDNLAKVEQNNRYKFIKGDIKNRELVNYIFKEFAIDGVVHFAAESHVDNSITNPGIFVETNVNGTYALMDAAKNAWMEKPFQLRSGCAHNRFHHISTDEVYGSLGTTGLFTETTAYAPNSPYSASKAASDMLVRAYHETFGLNVVVTHCSNNYGPRQHDEKLIPTIIRKALNLQPIPIYGDGRNVRDWLYVLDHCRGIDIVFHDGIAGQSYNIGGRNERNNLYIAETICGILDRKCPRNDGLYYKSQICFVDDRAGHDRRYAIDASKIENELGWSPNENFNTGIIKTVQWYLEQKR